MLTRQEKKDYILKHKKELQKQSDDLTRENNNLIKQLDKDLYEIRLISYKYQKEKNPKGKIKKPKLIKSHQFKLTKNSKNYIKSLYETPHVAHKEKLHGIDLKPYLQKIRKRKNEYLLVLLVRNNKVIKEYVHTTNSQASVKLGKFEKEIIKNAKKYKADVYLVHNHPIVIVANPSRQDIKYYVQIKKRLKEKNINIIDCAVVTFDDYYSYETQKRITNKVIRIAKNDGVKNKYVLELLDFTFIARTNHTLYMRKKSHPNYPYNSDKQKQIMAIPNNKYKKIKLCARKEYNKIINKYPQYAF